LTAISFWSAASRFKSITGGLPATVHHGRNLWDVWDVAEGNLFAWQKGRAGERRACAGVIA